MNGHSFPTAAARLLISLLALAALLVPRAALTQAIPIPGTTTADVQITSATSVAASGITFRGAGAVLSLNNGGSGSPGLPAGTAVDDILICVAESRSDTAPTISGGWNTIFNDGTGGNHHAAVFWRRADGTAADTPTLDNNNNESFAARIYGFIGVDTTTAIEDSGFSPSGSDLTTEAPAIVTASPGAMLVFAAMMADNHTGFSVTTGNTVAGWQGTAATTFSSLNLNEDLSLGIMYGVTDDAGAKGPFVMTRTGGANVVSHGAVIALKPAVTPAGNFTINKPTATVQDDVLIATIVAAPAGVAILAPSGWTEIQQLRNGNTNPNQLRVYRKTATAAEGASYSWYVAQIPAAFANGIVGSIVRFQNVDTTTPVDASGGASTPSGTTHNVAAVVTTVPDTMLVTSHGYSSSRNWTPPTAPGTAPTTMTELVDRFSAAFASTAGVSLSVNAVEQAATGTTGTRGATAAASADVGNAQIVALRPRVHHFAISVSGGGNGCAPVLTITAQDASNSTVTNYVGTINLSVSTGFGDWAFGSAPTPSGTLSNGAADDGVATYQFATADSGVVKLRLLNNRNESATVTVVDSTRGSTSTTTGAISFVVKTLSITKNPSDSLEIAGKNQAWRTTVLGNGVACAGFTGSVPVRAYFTRDTDDPNGAAPSITGMSSPPLGTSVPGADNLTLSFTNGVADFTLVTTDVGKYVLNMRDTSTTFINGNLDAVSPTITTRPFALGFPGIQHSTSQTGTFLAKAGNSFSATVTAYLWQAADDIDNNGVPDAGANVTNNGATPSFAWPVTISADATLFQPATGTAGSVTRGGGGAATIAQGTFSGGSATVSDLEYSEVGNVTLIATASNYLNSAGVTVGASSNGNSGLDGTGSAGGYVGRFTPAKFALSANGTNGPVLVNRVNTVSCADPATTTTAAVGAGSGSFAVTSAAGFVTGDTIVVVGAGTAGSDHVTTVTVSGTTFTLGAVTVTAVNAGTPVRRLGFSYMNEAFRISFRLTAQNAFNNTTVNYTGAYAKLGLASTASLGLGALSGTTNLTSRLDTALAPSGSWSAGIADVGVTIALRRASPDAPDGPYDTLRVGIAPDDNDPAGNGTRITSFNLDVDNNATNEHASVGTTRARFGRLALTNASGSERIDLNLPIAAQYWTGSGYLTNTLDSCTSLAQDNLALDNYAGSVNPGAGNCKTFVKNAPITLSAGTGRVQFEKPLVTGSLRVTARLGATGAPTDYCTNASNPPVSTAADASLAPLLGRWNDSANPDGDANTSSDDNPSARAAFGVYGSQPRNYIFFRENY